MMKKILAFLGMVVFCFSLTAYADRRDPIVSDYVSGDYGYNLNEDGSATIVSFNENKNYELQYYTGGSVLYIPNMLDGHPVTKLGGRSFWYETPRNITTIVVPEGVTTIENCALYSGDFPTVYLPSTLTTIERNTFKGVKTVICYSTNVEIDENTFRSCKGTVFYGYPSSTLEAFVKNTKNKELEDCVFADIADAPTLETLAATYLVTVSPYSFKTTIDITPSYAKAGELITITTSSEEGAYVSNISVVERGVFADGTEVAVTNYGNGVFSFIMPDSNVYVDVEEHWN